MGKRSYYLSFLTDGEWVDDGGSWNYKGSITTKALVVCLDMNYSTLRKKLVEKMGLNEERFDMKLKYMSQVRPSLPPIEVNDDEDLEAFKLLNLQSKNAIWHIELCASLSERGVTSAEMDDTLRRQSSVINITQSHSPPPLTQCEETIKVQSFVDERPIQAGGKSGGFAGNFVDCDMYETKPTIMPDNSSVKHDNTFASCDNKVEPGDKRSHPEMIDLVSESDTESGCSEEGRSHMRRKKGNDIIDVGDDSEEGVRSDDNCGGDSCENSERDFYHEFAEESSDNPEESDGERDLQQNSVNDGNTEDGICFDVDEEVLEEMEAEYYRNEKAKKKIVDLTDPNGGKEIEEAELGINEGDFFNCKKDLQMRLKMIAIAQRFQMQVVKSDKSLYILKCTYPSCTFFCRGSKFGKTDLFMVRKYRGQHSCGMKVKHNHHTHASSSVISEVIMSSFSVVGTSSGPTPADIQDTMKKMGVDVSYDKANRARKTAIDRIRGTAEQNYKRIHGYMYMLEKMNPGIITDVKLDGNGRFKYCFFSLGAWRRAVPFLRKVVTVDGTHLGSKYKGHLLVAVAQDGNRQIYPMAFGIVDSENDSSWSYFFQQLRYVVADEHDLVFVSDRHGSIFKGIRDNYVFAKHGCCTLHLFANIKVRFKRNDLWGLYQKANQAYTKHEFNVHFGQLCNESKEVGEYLKGVGFQSWARSHMCANRFNIMTSNNAESINSRLKLPRGLPLIGLIESIVNVMMNWFYERREKAGSCSEVLTPTLCREVEVNYLRSLTMTIFRLNQYEFEAHDKGQAFLINLHARTCYCNAFQIDQIPCSHAIAAATMCGVDPVQLVHPFFTVEKWKEAYKETLYPVPMFERWEVPPTVLNKVCLPPNVRKKSGRPRKKRIPSRGEYRGPKRKCGSCRTLGHNTRNCPNPSTSNDAR